MAQLVSVVVQLQGDYSSQRLAVYVVAETRHSYCGSYGERGRSLRNATPTDEGWALLPGTLRNPQETPLRDWCGLKGPQWPLCSAGRQRQTADGRKED